MTKQEILDGLEGLKELTNTNGKITIDALKAGISGLEEPTPKPLPKVEEKEPDQEPEEVAMTAVPKAPRKPYKRRSK